jgi:soluble lytic murein transglycosylase-like protein
MPRKNYSSNPYKKRTPGNKSGGFLFDLKLPPLAVILVSLLMTGLLTQVTAASTVSYSGYAGDTQIAPLFTSEVQYWEREISTWSQEHNLDPNLVATVMQIESCGNPRAKSSAGAMGLFQVMPYHFAASENPYKANTNALRGLSFLKMALEAREGNVKFGLAGYNAGITGAKRSEFFWPSETIRYVYWGMGIYSDAQQGKANSERLNEWLSAGGASLCRKAAEQLGIP